MYIDVAMGLLEKVLQGYRTKSLFTCVRGLVSSSSSWDNKLTFLSAVETLVSCEKFDHM